jgi:cytochrome c553
MKSNRLNAVSLINALAVALATGWLSGAQAQSANTKPSIEKGKEIATKVCAACHGQDGNSPTPVNPKLAGQIPEYMEKQLANFKANTARKNPVMMAMAAPLSTEDARNVAAYFAAQKAKDGAAKNAATIALGRQLYRGGDVGRGLAACAACHGPTGAGLPAQFPRLAGQYADYTEAQLKAFRVGERANDANRSMRTIAEKLSDAEIKAVSDYIAGLH